ncbi:hypothetical protein MKEN_00186800 [Mycena kentingensis (nom. inval.)]|nr:hypothetical protein MKEN_00186800 [Mycena kentingensis (nom. inval.)]
MAARPNTNLKAVLDTEVKEWHFHIYFQQGNSEQAHYAQELRDAVLRLRRDGAFIAVPLFRVHADPFGPHPVGSYEIWVPAETFSSVYSYLCLNRGPLSIMVHPLTQDERADHDSRASWIGPAYPLDLSKLPVRNGKLPVQYPSLRTGYSSKVAFMSIEDRAAMGANVERVLAEKEKDAARAPIP